MFPSYRGSQRAITARALRRRIDYYLSVAGLKRPGLSAHSLRSTSATLAMENGATLIEIQRHLDHQSVETTLRYISRLERLNDKAAARVPIRIS